MKVNHTLVLGIFILVSLVSFDLLVEAKKKPSSILFQSTRINDELRKKLDAWVSMWNTYDLLQAKKLFLNSDQITYFSSEKEGVLKGMDAIIEHHKGFGFVDGGKVQANKLWLEQVSMQSFGSVSVVTAIWFFKRGGATNKIQKGPVTIVYVKMKNKYLIAHMHFANYSSTGVSVPNLAKPTDFI